MGGWRMGDGWCGEWVMGGVENGCGGEWVVSVGRRMGDGCGGEWVVGVVENG